MRMIEVVAQQLAQAPRLQRSMHGRLGRLRDVFGLLLQFAGSVGKLDLGNQLRAEFASYFDQKFVRARSDDFRKSQIVTAGSARTSAHRGTEAKVGRVRTLDRDDH